MPRIEGLSGCSTTCCIRRKPKPRIVCRMPRGQPMKLTTHLIFKVPDCLSDLLPDFFLVGVIVLFGSRGYETGSSAPLPRFSATLAASFRCKSASNVALITLCGFDVPNDFVNTF
jgi:hypothetical protein